MGAALAKLMARMKGLKGYVPSKRDVAVSAITGLAVGTPIAMGREKLMEEDRLKAVSKKAREAARDSARRLLKKAQREG
jgi:hypothetical protein